MDNEEMNFELNLLPVISLLAVCISFLLLTAVWVNIGTLDIKQAIGESAELAKETPTLRIEVTSKGKIVANIKNLKSKIKNLQVGTSDKDFENFNAFIIDVREKHPELVTATVVPSQATKYQSLIKVFETLKTNQIKDIGVSPI